jgi:glycosyltransferase involved in cell wall biosynthesis
MKRICSNPLRILFLFDDKFPPFRVDVKVLIGELLSNRGHEIDCIFQSKDACSKNFITRWYNSRAIVGKTLNSKTIIGRGLSRIYELVNDLNSLVLISKGNYDLIVVKDKFISGLITIIYAKIFNIKTIFWLSYPFPEASIYRSTIEKSIYKQMLKINGLLSGFILYRCLLKLVDHAFVQTDKMKQNVQSRGQYNGKLTTLPMGISDNEIPYFGYKKLAHKTEMKVAYLGTLVRTRRIDFLVRSFSFIVKQYSQAKLMLIGGGADDDDISFLKKEIAKFNLEKNISITGFMDQKEAWQLIRDADVCVSPLNPIPILTCGFPTKLIEYMAMGKACVVNDHPEQKKIIAESGGGLCVPYEEDQFANAIMELLRKPEDAAEMGRKGYIYVSQNKNYSSILKIFENTAMIVCKGNVR